MKALIWRELRRTLPMAGVILVAALVFGLADLLVNWHRALYVGISYWFCVMMAGLIAVGAGLVGRAANTPDLRFLLLWPTTRARIWLVKLLMSLFVGAMTIIGSFVLCAALLALRGYDPLGVFRDQMSFPTGFWRYIFPAALLLAFALSFFWSQMVEAGLTLVLTIVSWLALTGGAVFVLVLVLPGRLGPWLRFSPAFLDTTAKMAFMLTVALVLSIVVAGAAAVAFWRIPLLETRRRAGTALLAVVVLLALAALATLPLLLDFAPLKLAGVGHLELDNTGHRILLQGTSLCDTQEVEGIWSLDPISGKLRLLVRHAYLPEYPPGGRKFLVNIYGFSWLADLDTGRLSRYGALYSGSIGLSPQGRYFLKVDYRRGDPWIALADGRVIVPLGRDAQVIGWDANDAAVYVSMSASGTGSLPREAWRIALPGGEQKRICQLDSDFLADWQSLHSGKWIVGRSNIDPRTPATIFVDTRNGQVHRVSGFEPSQVWSADERYVWGRAWTPDHKQARVVLDTTTFCIVSRIGRERLQGQGPGLPYTSPQRDWVYFNSYGGHREMALWRADLSGQHLQRLGSVSASVSGVMANNELLMQSAQSLTLLNPQTMQQRVLLTLPRRPDTSVRE